MQLEGRQLVISALKENKQIEKIQMLRNASGDIINEIYKLAKDKRVPIIRVERQKLNSISKTNNHQGVIAILPTWQYSELDDVLTKCSKKDGYPFLLMLDHLNDPHNFGSIIRTADAAGVDGIIIPHRRSVGITEVVMKVSAGAITNVPIVKVTKLNNVLQDLKKQGFWVVGTDANTDKMIYDVDLKMPIVMLIGSEGKGLGKPIKDKCDFLVKLPMKGHVSSLNASVAAGICMFEVVRQQEAVR
ncbi:23S rRNA (guanosine(2251)-2'-O)-methyltransferase RlmB [Clostridium sp. 'deep sea']|uniref:23S rRNA (guanosine(2251)-2'-O)-methyltransferase RlmB n=1 Tax=Clostridium sp. 'deep sea' TaxID=2779445 RepID=UPI0018969E0F|nr:23S rRNA (guanosine(2251)-2'-O)-methyltransferase RlmB [Clostridium sp. 'deep sea']QOR34557.1 23S rRNA (guanosine(2251)-2'-O)-methyltransferase RlmB [Clostridium sp. 'deep sea']